MRCYVWHDITLNYNLYHVISYCLIINNSLAFVWCLQLLYGVIAYMDQYSQVMRFFLLFWISLLYYFHQMNFTNSVLTKMNQNYLNSGIVWCKIRFVSYWIISIPVIFTYNDDLIMYIISFFFIILKENQIICSVT